MSEEPARLAVDLGSRSYDILIGERLIEEAGGRIRPLLRTPRVFVLTDRNVAERYLPRLRDSLAAAGILEAHLVLEPGEGAKDFAHLERVVDATLAAGIERGAAMLALGGGVVGDLAGFAASIVLRGIDFVQIPTTLLAQVDSAVGGKTGINTRHGKNLVGSFHQPRLVLADTATLGSLPGRELRAGYAEVVKYGLIGDAAFFAWLERNGEALLAGDAAARRHAILTSCAAKAAIVGADEREAGPRALLNLGHTFGHALEAEAGYSDGLLHGEAVAIGMVLAFRLSARLGLCPPADAERVAAHLAAVGLPTRPEQAGLDLRPDRLLAHMARDKKVKDGHIRFVLVQGIGRAFLAEEVDTTAVRSLLEQAAAA